MTAASAALGAALAWWHWGGLPLALLATAAGLLLLIAVVAPRIYQPVFKVLDRAVQGVLAAFTWFLLGLVYFGLFTPLGSLLRLFGRNPLGSSSERDSTTFWEPVKKPAGGRSPFLSQS